MVYFMHPIHNRNYDTESSSDGSFKANSDIEPVCKREIQFSKQPDCDDGKKRYV